MNWPRNKTVNGVYTMTHYRDLIKAFFTFKMSYCFMVHAQM